nr:MAG TPA: hypothetical protein [Inoviridae sp.]
MRNISQFWRSVNLKSLCYFWFTDKACRLRKASEFAKHFPVLAVCQLEIALLFLVYRSNRTTNHDLTAIAQRAYSPCL